VLINISLLEATKIQLGERVAGSSLWYVLSGNWMVIELMMVTWEIKSSLSAPDTGARHAECGQLPGLMLLMVSITFLSTVHKPHSHVAGKSLHFSIDSVRGSSVTQALARSQLRVRAEPS
jgi:hypothetical protein